MRKQLIALITLCSTGFSSLALAALTSEQCNNSFTIRGTRDYHVGIFDENKKIKIIHQRPTLGPTGGGYFICEEGLFAFVADSRTVKKTTLHLEEVNYLPNADIPWWRKILEIFGVNKFKDKSYDLNDAGTESLQYRNGTIEIHDNTMETIVWDDSMGDKSDQDINRFSTKRLGQEALQITKTIVFDVKNREFLPSRKRAATCNRRTSSLEGCGGGLFDVNQDSLVGHKKLLFDFYKISNRDDLNPNFGTLSQVAGIWKSGDRYFLMTDEAKTFDSEIYSKDFFEILNGKAIKIGAAPSPNISYVINSDGLLQMISIKDKKIYQFNPNARKYTIVDVPLDSETQEIVSATVTKDYFVIAQNFAKPNNYIPLKILILEKKNLKKITEYTLHDNIREITTFYKPERANQTFDGLNYSIRRKVAQ